jgi:hypothetical protein
MSAEIIYGVDFRAGKEDAPLCNAPDLIMPIDDYAKRFIAQHDTAPSEYTAPDGDCA